MKRAIALTLVLFLLSAAGLTAVTLWMCRAQEQVEFINTVERGDKAAADGLRMTEYDLLEGRVLWTTEHDLGSESRETKASFFGREQGYYYSYGEQFGWYSICAVAPGGEEVESDLQRKMTETMNREVLVYPAEYTEHYDVCIVDRYDGNRQMVTEREREQCEYAEVPLLRIPAEKEDVLELIGNSYEDPREYSCGYAGIANAFTPYSLEVPGGTVMTVGFDPKVQAKTDWAPEGFGLWRLRSATKEEPQRKIELVYPLNIESQQVVKLATSADREKLLLFLAEGEELTLQVLRSDTFALEQTVALGKIGVQETEESYPLENGEELRRMTCDYETVQVRKGEDFYAVAAGKRLTVLQSGEKGLEILFSCDMPDLYVLPVPNGMEYGWADEEERPADEYLGAYNPADETGWQTFEGMSMVLRDGKLAIAWSTDVTTYGGVAVQIYDETGLVYARYISSKLYGLDVGAVSIRNLRQPELVWAE